MSDADEILDLDHVARARRDAADRLERAKAAILGVVGSGPATRAYLRAYVAARVGGPAEPLTSDALVALGDRVEAAAGDLVRLAAETWPTASHFFAARPGPAHRFTNATAALSLLLGGTPGLVDRAECEAIVRAALHDYEMERTAEDPRDARIAELEAALRRAEAEALDAQRVAEAAEAVCEARDTWFAEAMGTVAEAHALDGWDLASRAMGAVLGRDTVPT